MDQKAPKVKLYKEAKRRVRWITPDQAKALLAELQEHQRAMVLFSPATSLRQDNLTGLSWSQVDLGRRTAWVHGDDATNCDDLHVPLNDIAIDVLQRQRGNRPERVFTYKGKPINWANTRGWRSALVRAGISNFRWHDLCLTWASWLLQHGTLRQLMPCFTSQLHHSAVCSANKKRGHGTPQPLVFKQ